MKRVALCAVSLLLAVAAVAPARARSAPRLASRDVLVLLRDDALELGGDGALRARSATLAKALTRNGLVHGERLGPIATRDGLPAPRLMRLRGDGLDPVAAARDLMASGAVRAACPDYRIGLEFTPSDSLLDSQWYVVNAVRADIHLPEAWDVARGDTSVLIAIVDTGVDTGHPDLASQIWTNRGEIPGNGIDDDANGLIDDVHGWDFGDGDNDPNPVFVSDGLYGVDLGFHGTFCAGIADAATDNGRGIAGAGWRCRMIPIKAASVDSGLTTSAVAAGIEYAAALHADVLSMSFGAADDPGVPEFFQALVDDALAAGTICVAAAGNAGDSLKNYPAACAGVISVGATDELDERASFSSYGPWVDVAAPGAAMLSTINRNYDLDFLSEFWYEVFNGYDGVNPYMYGDGTSFACPLVAGVCGLLRGHAPTLTPAAARELLIATGDAVAYDQPIGKKVNAWRALTQVLAVAPPRPVAGGVLQLEAPRPNPSTRGATLRFVLPAAGAARLALYDCAGRAVRELTRGTLPAGPHAVAWDGRSDGGAPLPGGIYFARLESGGRTAVAKLVRIER